jgi:hypothetical protein
MQTGIGWAHDEMHCICGQLVLLFTKSNHRGHKSLPDQGKCKMARLRSLPPDPGEEPMEDMNRTTCETKKEIDPKDQLTKLARTCLDRKSVCTFYALFVPRNDMTIMLSSSPSTCGSMFVATYTWVSVASSNTRLPLSSPIPQGSSLQAPHVC